MQHPPRAAREPLLGRQTFTVSLLQGLSVLAVVVGVFSVAYYGGRAGEEARALTFTTLVLANLALIFANRSWGKTILGRLRSPNPALWWVAGGTLCFLGVVIYVPLSRALFRFSILHLHDLAICLGAAILSISWFEVFKLWKAQARSKEVRKAQLLSETAK